MYKQIFTFFFIPVSLLLCLGSCKKSANYDKRPFWRVSANLTFTPEDIGTTGTNQTDTLCAGVGSLYINSSGSDSSTATVYFDIDGKVYTPANPPYPESYGSITYYVAIASPKFKKGSLQTGQMYWTSSTSQTNDPTFATMGYYAGERHDNVWQTLKKSSNINFSSFADSYIKFTITKIYTTHEEDGNFTYVDGGFDVTMLGAGHAFTLSPANYWDQVHLTGSFYNMRLEGY